MLVHPVKGDLMFLKINARLCLWSNSAKAITVHHVTSYGLKSDDPNCSHLLLEVVMSSKDKIKLNKGMPKFKQRSH